MIAQVIETINWRFERTFDTVYQYHELNDDIVKCLCNDIMYHLWADIPNRVRMGPYRNMFIHAVHDTSHTDAVVIKVTVDIDDQHIVCTCVASIKPQTFTLTDIVW